MRHPSIYHVNSKEDVKILCIFYCSEFVPRHFFKLEIAPLKGSSRKSGQLRSLTTFERVCPANIGWWSHRREHSLIHSGTNFYRLLKTCSRSLLYRQAFMGKINCGGDFNARKLLIFLDFSGYFDACQRHFPGDFNARKNRCLVTPCCCLSVTK